MPALQPRHLLILPLLAAGTYRDLELRRRRNALRLARIDDATAATAATDRIATGSAATDDEVFLQRHRLFQRQGDGARRIREDADVPRSIRTDDGRVVRRRQPVVGGPRKGHRTG